MLCLVAGSCLEVLVGWCNYYFIFFLVKKINEEKKPRICKQIENF